jgi:enamine deaminase RidA (YjgF/YER057c/UK114 family)
MSRKTVSSGSPLEPTIGFSRAVRVGPLIAVSGTAPIADDGSTAAVGDLYGQAVRCLEITRRAIEQAGGAMSGVYRTRIMLTDIASWEEAARAHGEFFGSVKPACTFVEVSGFIRADWLVETEADCYVD